MEEQREPKPPSCNPSTQLQSQHTAAIPAHSCNPSTQLQSRLWKAEARGGSRKSKSSSVHADLETRLHETLLQKTKSKQVSGVSRERLFALVSFLVVGIKYCDRSNFRGKEFILAQG